MCVNSRLEDWAGLICVESVPVSTYSCFLQIQLLVQDECNVY